MEGRLPRFRNLLTDNGSQFDRANGRARAYCHASGTHHIWSTPGHPQTLGKVGRVQKDLKRILVLAGWTDRADLSRKVSAYVAFYNHACVHRRIGSTPIQREGGEEDSSWFLPFAHAFSLGTSSSPRRGLPHDSPSQ
jgi:transposase InsO family protein